MNLCQQHPLDQPVRCGLQHRGAVGGRGEGIVRRIPEVTKQLLDFVSWLGAGSEEEGGEAREGEWWGGERPGKRGGGGEGAQALSCRTNTCT